MGRQLRGILDTSVVIATDVDPIEGELAISSADLTACFGAFTRGDVVVTIQAQPSALTAKARIASPNGTVVEQSLGGLQVQQAGNNVGGITY